MSERICYKCVYYNQCGDPSRTEPCDGKEIITEGMAKAFYRDLCGSFGTNGSDAVVSYDQISERMGISVKRATEYCQVCFKYGITEKQGGGVVI